MMIVRKPARARSLVIAQRIEQLLDIVLALLLALVVCSLVWQVFARYALGRAPGWTEEVARMTVAWMAMLGAAACLRRGEHIAVRVLVMSVPEGLRRVLLLVRDALVLLTAAVLGWAGARFALLNIDQDSPALEIPMAVPYSAMAVGAVLLALVLMLARLGGEPPPVDAIGEESP